MRYEDIEAEFNKFFEFPGADRSTVTSVSAKLFARHIAMPIEARAEKLQAELDALNDNTLPDPKKSTLRGFGVTMAGGGARSWYVGKDGVKRWADNNLACGESIPSNCFIYKE